MAGIISKLFGKKDAAATQSLYVEKAVGQLWQNTYYLPDPDHVIQLMGGRHKLRDLLADDEISSALQVRLAAAISTPWSLEGGDSAVNDFVIKEITDRIYDIFNDAFDAVKFGYAVLELIWEVRDDGSIGFQRIQGKPIEWFIPQRNGRVMFRDIYLSTPGEEFPEEKFLLVQNRPTYLNPYGEALLTKVFYPYKFRCAGWQFWSDALQKFATPFIHAQIDGMTNSATGKDSAEELAAALNQQKRGSAVVTPTGVTLAVLGGNLTSGVFREFEESVDNRIRRTVLGANLSTNVRAGSLAAAEVHNEVRNDIRRFDIMLLTQTVQRLVNAVYRLNGFTGDIPQFSMQDEAGLERARADRDAVLTGAKMVKFKKEYIIDRYDLEDADFDVPSDAIQAGPIPTLGFSKTLPSAAGAPCKTCGGQHHAGDPYRFVDRSTLPDNQQKVELLGDAALASTPEGGVTRPAVILAAVRSARSQDDLRKKLALLIGDNNENFEEHFTLATYVATGMGYLNGRRDL